MFVDCFSPESHDEGEKQAIFNSTVKAIKAFKANIVIVLNENIVEQDLRKTLQEDKAFLAENQTVVLFLKYRMPPMATDTYSLYKEYFMGKNFQLTERKAMIRAKIEEIKKDAEQKAILVKRQDTSQTNMNVFNGQAMQEEQQSLVPK